MNTKKMNGLVTLKNTRFGGRILRRSIVSLLLLSALSWESCGIYSLGGVNIPEEMKTVSVPFVENNAPLVIPSLANEFTEALKQKIRNESSLAVVPGNAHASFEGRITDYSVTSTAIQGNNVAGLLKLTITVSMKYTNTLKPEHSFEQTFSRSTEFKGPLQSPPQTQIGLVNKMLTEDIFNRAFANW